MVREWLPRSQTFVHSLVSAERAYDPVVLAGEVTRRDEFPVDRLHELVSPSASVAHRAARRLRARASGWDSSWEQQIFRASRDTGAAVLHAHFGPMGCRALAARERLAIPLVTTFYGSDLALPDSDRKWRARYDELFATGELFTCEGPAMAEHLAAIGCPADRIRIVRIGIQLERFECRPRVPRDDLVFIQTGRFVEKKGIDLSLRAFAEAGGPARGWRLLLIGDGPERSALESLAHRLGIAPNVAFLGLVSHAEYRDALREADVALQPSRTASDGDTEGGAPTVLLEMQAAGIPVIASDHADIPFIAGRQQIVPEGDAGAVAAAMIALSEQSPAAWTARAEAAREFVAGNHDSRAVALQAEAVYDEARGHPDGGVRPQEALAGARS